MIMIMVYNSFKKEIVESLIIFLTQNPIMNYELYLPKFLYTFF